MEFCTVVPAGVLQDVHISASVNANANHAKKLSMQMALANGGKFGQPHGGGAARTSFVVKTAAQAARLQQYKLDLAALANNRRRKVWTEDWVKTHDFLSNEVITRETQLRKTEHYHYSCFLAITEGQFRFLVRQLEPIICQYPPERKKKPFSAEERLAITLKYLATGEVHSCRNYCFRATKTVILQMIASICRNIYDLLKDEYIILPKTESDWEKLAADWQSKTKLPYCLGNAFMRRISLNKWGSTLAQLDATPPMFISGIVDSNHNFLGVDVESPPQGLDECNFYENSFLRRTISCTAGRKTHNVLPYFIGDCGLPNSANLVTSQSIRYRCDPVLAAFDQVTKHTDETLRMLSNIFPILAQPLTGDRAHTKDILLGCVALYNFLRNTNKGFMERTNAVFRKSLTSSYHDNFSDEDNGDEDDDDDDDCIVVSDADSDDDRPAIALVNCFDRLRTQYCPADDDESKRNWLLDLSQTIFANESPA